VIWHNTNARQAGIGVMVAKEHLWMMKNCYALSNWAAVKRISIADKPSTIEDWRPWA